jgi:hypothetical protein
LIFAKTIAAVVLAGSTLIGAAHSRRAVVNPNANPPVVTITAHDYYFDPIPDIPSGVVDLRLHNTGKDFHHAAIFKLAGRHTAADFVATLKNPGPPPAWATPTPGPNAPPLGQTSNSIAELTPGNYVVVCFIDTNGGVPHVMKGMSRGFRVVKSANTSRAPKADMNLTVADYSFKFVPEITAGTHLIRISNTSMQPHEIEIFRLLDGKTAKQLHDWALTPMTTPPPGLPVGGIVGIMPGTHPEFRVTLTTGHYVAMCFITDAKDGKPHILHGMEYAFELK